MLPAVPDMDSYVTCSKNFFIYVKLQGFPIDSYTFA